MRFIRKLIYYDFELHDRSMFNSSDKNEVKLKYMTYDNDSLFPFDI